jgi:hypothetical protein
LWSGKGKRNKAAATWQRALRRLWKLVKPTLVLLDREGRRIHPEISYVPQHYVAMLLGDAPDTVREHYYPWVPGLQKELERAVKSSWSDGVPIIMDDVDKALRVAGRA